MEELQRKKASRKAYRSHLTRLLRKVDAILDSDTRPTEAQIATLTSSIEQLTERGTLLRELDNQIAATIGTEDELEAEIIEAEATQESIHDKISQIRRVIELHTTPPTRTLSVSATEFVPASDPPPRREPPVSRLPKLDLPSFSGDPLTWQSFWDSFRAAVHTNAALDGVQKFNYLKAQLHGDASRAIAGLPLTSANYDHAVSLLRERFGQSHKIISAHMQALLDIPKPVISLSSLRLFQDSVESHIRGLAALGKSEESYGALLVPIILGKLPAETRSNLAQAHINPEWTLSELKDCIKTEIRVLESGFSNELSKKISSTGGDSPTMTTASFYTGASNSTPRQSTQYKPKSCTYCQSTTHSTSSCDVVTDSGKRLEFVRRENLCFNCLGQHRAAQCKSKSRCKRCKGKHHTSLCENMSQKDKQLKQEAPPPPNTQTSTTALTVSVPADQPSNDLLTTDTGCVLKTAAANVRSGSHCCRAQILFDEGAQRSFMTQQLARDLNIQPYKRQKICVSAFGGETVPKELQLASLAIQTRYGGEVPISVLVVPKIAAPFQNLVPVPGDKYLYLRNLPLAHPVGNTNKFEISLLIGADFYWKIVQDKIIRGDGPTAVESKLGYLLSGPLSSHGEADDVEVFHVRVMGIEDTSTTQFWDVESTGTLPTTISAMTRDYQFLAAYLKSSVHQNQDGSYTLGFPWKTDHPPLPSNRSICERRTRSLARKLAQTPELLQIYGNIIADQVKRGFVERVRECDIPHDCHFIPHHAVKKQSATTPVRIVYDCSCRQSPSYPSLNDCLQVGPPFLIDLCTLLLRFRSHRFALVSDIEKAFLHVHLAEKDRSYTHFLWLSEPDNPESLFIIYRFCVVLFGSVSSPFMLHAALQYHLTVENSATASDILANLYVDNIVSGCSSEARALQYYKEARSLMSKANFNLRSWASNSSSLTTLAQQDGVANNHLLVNVLGLLWDTSQDTISIK